MAHVRVETSVPRHRKFLAAGPAASWLWLAGCCYCNEGLTDGHIPAAALPTLGVTGAARLVPRLLSAGLWDTDPGGDGWRVHDYLDQNRTADHVREITRKRKEAGAAGGAASWEKRKQSASVDASKVLNPTTTTTTTTTNSVNDNDTVNGAKVAPDVPFAPEQPEPAQPPFASWLRELQDAYPERARTGGYLTESAFVGVFQRAADIAPHALMDHIRDGLRNQRQGAQWRRGMVPKLSTWLMEDRWKQRHDAVDASDVVSAKTQRTLAAAQAFLHGTEE